MQEDFAGKPVQIKIWYNDGISIMKMKVGSL